MDTGAVVIPGDGRPHEQNFAADRKKRGNSDDSDL